MKTFLIVPDEVLKAKIAIDAQDRLEQALKKKLSGYTKEHGIGVVPYLKTTLPELWNAIDDHVWSRTTALYQTYSIIRRCLGDDRLSGIVSGRVTIPSGIRQINLPVIGKVNTTFIRCINYDTPLLYRVYRTGRSDMLELAFSTEQEPIESERLFQELQHVMDNFSR